MHKLINCKKCNKKELTINEYITHINSEHIDENEQCKLCSTLFHENIERKKHHMNVIHYKKRYCFLCLKVFLDKFHLDNHIIEKHN